MSITSNPAATSRSAPGGELFRVGTHQLATDRMIILGQVEEVPRAMPQPHLQQKLVQHHFARSVTGSQTAGDHPHRPIAITGQGGLHDGKPNRDTTKV